MDPDFSQSKDKISKPAAPELPHIKAIQDTLGVDISVMHNVVAFAGSAEAKTDLPSNVVWNRKEMHRFIASRRAPQISASDIEEYADRLKSVAFENTRDTRKTHVQNVRAKAKAKAADKSKCPRCNANMVKRTNKNSGDTFMGCSRFPKCSGTRKLS